MTFSSPPVATTDLLVSGAGAGVNRKESDFYGPIYVAFGAGKAC